MVPIQVQKEQNGYVLNSWLMPLLTAGVSLVVNGVATPEDVDRTFMICNRGCAMGPCGLIDVAGMKTAYVVSQYWGTVSNDAQMLKNAAYVKERFLDQGLQGILGGEGFYRYPNLPMPNPTSSRCRMLRWCRRWWTTSCRSEGSDRGVQSGIVGWGRDVAGGAGAGGR
jgi:3-hydroxybutyryl-CoA dehydrogenase